LSVLCVYITISPGENFLRSIIESRLKKDLNIEAEIGELETNLFSRLLLSGVKVRQPNTDTGNELLSLDRVRVNYKISLLFTPKIFIESIDLLGLQISIQKDSSGTYNLPVFTQSQPKDTTSQGSFLKVQLGDVIVRNSSFQYEDVTIPLEGILNNFRFELEYADGDYTYKLLTDSTNIIYQSKPVGITKVAAAGTYQNKTIYLDTLQFCFPELEINGKGFINLGVTPGRFEGRIELTGNTGYYGDLFKDFLPRRFYPIGGALNAVIKADGTFDSPHATAELTISELQTGSLHIKNGELHSEYTGNRIIVHKMNIGVLGGEIDGTGSAALDSVTSHNFVLSVNGINMAALWRYLYEDKSPYRGILNGRINSEGPLTAPEKLTAKGELSLNRVRYMSRPVPDFTTHVTYKEDLAHFDFRQENSFIKADVGIEDNKIEGTYTAHIGNLRPLTGLLKVSELEGKLDVEGGVSGTLESPEVSADFSGAIISYRNFPLDTLSGKLRYKNGEVHIERSFFRAQQPEIDSSNSPFHVPGLRGGFSYSGNLKGTFPRMEGAVEIGFEELSYGKTGIDSGNVVLTLADNDIKLSSLRIAKDSLMIEASGDYSIQKSQGTFELLFTTTDTGRETHENGRPEYGKISAELDLSDSGAQKIEMRGTGLHLWELTGISGESIELEGILDFNFNFSGTPKNPRGDLWFSAGTPRFKKAFADSLRGRIFIEDELLSIEYIDILLGGQSSRAEGEIILEKTSSGNYTVFDSSIIDVTLEAVDSDLKMLQPLFPADTRLEGRTGYSIRAAGRAGAPRLRGNLTVSNAMFQMNSETPAIKEIDIRLTFIDSLIEMETISGRILDTPFKIAGEITTEHFEDYKTYMTITVSGDKVMNVRGSVTGDSVTMNSAIKDFGLYLLQPMVPGMKKIQGTLNSRLSLSGVKSDPQLSGILVINRLSFHPPVLPSPLTEGYVRIDFQGNTVTLDSLSVELNGGRIVAGGELVHKKNKLEDLNVRASLRNINLVNPEYYKLSLQSGNLNYRKEDSYYELDGDIILGETRFLYNVQPGDILSLLRSVERPSQKPAPIIRQTRVNVRLRESDNLWIDNNLARLRLHAELGFIGTLSRPNVTGRLSIEEGYVLYLDRKFRISQGYMDFINPNTINPVVDLKANTQVRSYQALSGQEYTITLSASGSLDKVVVDLTSEPALDKPDIIALLTVGVTREQMTGRGSTGEISVSEALKQRLEELSSSRISGYAEQNVGNLLGLEQMSIEGNLFNFGKSWGPQLLASKKISDRMEIIYTTTVGHLNEQRIRLDYRLSKYFSLEGQTDQKGQSGIDLKFRLKFK